MNIAKSLPMPLNTFCIDVEANTYYDFRLPTDSAYPLKGVTYPADYGNIPGYFGEDGHELDLFVGNTADGLCGNLVVYRGKETPNEHKFFVALTSEELQTILEQLKPVLVKHEEYSNIAMLLRALEKYKV